MESKLKHLSNLLQGFFGSPVGIGPLITNLILTSDVGGKTSVGIARPGTTSHTIVDIPEQHAFKTDVSGLATVEDHTEATVHDFTPTDTTAVVEGNPGGATESIANAVLDSHISAVGGSILNVGGLTERGVGARDVMVITRNHNRSGQFTASDSVVEGTGDGGTGVTISVENTSLRAHNELVGAGLLDPLKVIGQLGTYRSGRSRGDVIAEDLSGDLVGLLQIAFQTGSANPAERTEAEREDVAHDILDVGRIAEAADAVGLLAFLGEDVGTSTRSLQQEAVTVIPEEHATSGKLVDGGDLTSQGFLDEGLELDGVIVHHLAGFLEGELDRVVAAHPRVVERGLIGAEFDQELVFFSETFPEVDDVTQEADGEGFLF